MLTVLIPLFYIVAVMGPFVITALITGLDNLNIRKAVRERLVNENPGYQSALDPIPVNYSSELYFSQALPHWADRLHWIDYEAVGALFITRDEVIFVGSTVRSHKPIQIRFEPLNTRLSWAGRKLPKGMVYTQVSWLEISQKSERHYFTSETGISHIGSKARTSEFFQNLKHIFESSQESH